MQLNSTQILYIAETALYPQFNCILKNLINWTFIMHEKHYVLNEFGTS